MESYEEIANQSGGLNYDNLMYLTFMIDFIKIFLDFLFKFSSFHFKNLIIFSFYYINLYSNFGTCHRHKAYRECNSMAFWFFHIYDSNVCKPCIYENFIKKIQRND